MNYERWRRRVIGWTEQQYGLRLSPHNPLLKVYYNEDAPVHRASQGIYNVFVHRSNLLAERLLRRTSRFIYYRKGHKYVVLVDNTTGQHSDWDFSNVRKEQTCANCDQPIRAGSSDVYIEHDDNGRVLRRMHGSCMRRIVEIGTTMLTDYYTEQLIK